MTDPGAQVVHNGAGVANNSSTAAGRLACPVIDTSATPKTGITALSIVVVDDSTTEAVRTQACIQPNMAASRGPGLSGVVTAVIGLAAGVLGSAMFSHFRDANAEVKAPLPVVRATSGNEAAGTAHPVRWELARPGSECVIVAGRERRAA